MTTRNPVTCETCRLIKLNEEAIRASLPNDTLSCKIHGLTILGIDDIDTVTYGTPPTGTAKGDEQWATVTTKHEDEQTFTTTLLTYQGWLQASRTTTDSRGIAEILHGWANARYGN